MGKFGKLVFSMTALAPCAFAYAINRISSGESEAAIRWMIIGVLMCLVCRGILYLAPSRIESKAEKTKKVKLADKEVLSFLLAYLLPLTAPEKILMSGDTLTIIFIYVIIMMSVYHSNAFTFNPLLAAMGFHFYEIENEEGISYLLLTRKPLHKCEESMRVISLGEYLYLDVENQ